MGIFHGVVKNPYRNRVGVLLKLRQNAGDLQRMHEIRLAGKSHLSTVDLGREDVSTVDDVQISLRIVADDRVAYVLDANHG